MNTTLALNASETTKILNFCSDVGLLLLESGAETFRVEETVERIGAAANLPISCYSTMTSIFISVQHTSQTLLVKTTFGSYDLQKVDQINQLSRDFEAGNISFEIFATAVRDLHQTSEPFPLYLQMLGAGLVAIAPMFVFKAAWTDLALSFFIGISGFLGSKYITKLGSVPYLSEIFGGFVVGILGLLAVKYGVGINSYTIIVSAIMPLVPGVAITNAIREIIANEIVSGIVRLTNAILVAGAISFGILLAVELI